MDSVTQCCRLCLESSDDVVNIFDKFHNSTIAEILTKHFWFQVHKNDGFSECLCLLCWTNTKTFHEFYEKVEFLQKCSSDSVGKDCIETSETDDIVGVETVETQSSSDLIIRDENVDSPTDGDIIFAREESNAEVIEISKNCDSDCDDTIICDESNFIVEEPDQTSDSYYTDDVQLESDVTEDQTLRDIIECCNSDDDDDEEYVDESHENSNSQPIHSRCKKDTAKEDAQIREFFSMVCQICSDHFETFSKAKSHYRIVHKTVGYLTCCGKKFLRRGRVLDHIYRHLNPDAYRCDPCGKRFADKFSLKNHIENHEPINSRAYKCGLCSSSFTKASKLAQHERLRHCSEEDKKFCCDKCNKNFVSKSVLASHVRGVHEFAFAHVCDICARVFKSKHVFQNHMQEHSAITRPKMQCNVCGAWLKHEESLRKHLKRHQDTFANCPICNKRLQNKHSLGNHIRSVHGERSHQCTFCGKAFKKAIVLKEHMALHTGQDLYNCPYCTKTFKSGANMHAHRKKAHFAEWTRDRSKRFTPTVVESQ